MKAPMIIKKYPKSLSGLIEKKIGIWWMGKRGYIVYAEEDYKEYSAGKGCMLALIFLPLALFGGKRYWKITFLSLDAQMPGGIVCKVKQPIE